MSNILPCRNLVGIRLSLGSGLIENILGCGNTFKIAVQCGLLFFVLSLGWGFFFVLCSF